MGTFQQPWRTRVDRLRHSRPGAVNRLDALVSGTERGVVPQILERRCVEQLREPRRHARRGARGSLQGPLTVLTWSSSAPTVSSTIGPGTAPRGCHTRPLGGIVLHDLRLAASGPNRLDAFVIGTNNALFQKTWNGAAWGAYVQLGGVCIASPAAVSRAPNQLDVFVIGTDNAVHHRHFNGTSWGGFTSLGGVVKLGVGASAAGPNRLDVFAIGMNNALYQKTWNGAAWSGWQNLGGVCISAPAAVAQGPNRIDTAPVYGTNSAVFQKNCTADATR